MYQLSPVSVKEFLGKTPEEIKWVWEPFIPAGSLCMCAAYMKTGKSTLVYGLLAAVVRGDPFVAYPTTKTNTLLLAVEEHPRDIAIRLSKFGLSKELDDPLWIHAAPVVPDKVWYDSLANYIIEKEIGLLVIDTLAHYWTVLDENDNAEVHRAMAPLLWVARTTGAAVLLIHHTNKGEGTGGRLIRGASASFGIVDQALILHRYGDPESPKRRLETLGRYDASPREIIVALDGDAYVLIGDPTEASLDTLRNTIKELLTAAPLTSLAIADALQVSPKKVQKALAKVVPGISRSGTGKKGDPFVYSIDSGGSSL